MIDSLALLELRSLSLREPEVGMRRESSCWLRDGLRAHLVANCETNVVSGMGDKGHGISGLPKIWQEKHGV